MNRIAVISDIHYKPSTHEKIVSELETLVETFEAELNPSRVVILGDMIHETDDIIKARDHASVITNILADLSCPVRYLPGNHDVVNASPTDYWETTYGHSPWTIDSDDSIAFLDSSAPRLGDGRGEITAPQLDNLTAAIPTWEHGLVFVHHPLHYTDVSENKWFNNTPEKALCGNKETFWRRLGENPPIAATINGHLHQGGHTRYRGLDHFSIESFNKELTPDQPYGAYAVIERGTDLQVQLVLGSGRSETYQIPLPTT